MKMQGQSCANVLSVGTLAAPMVLVPGTCSCPQHWDSQGWLSPGLAHSSAPLQGLGAEEAIPDER